MQNGAADAIRSAAPALYGGHFNKGVRVFVYGRDGDGAFGHRLGHGAKKSVHACTGAKTLLCSGIDERKKSRNLGKKRRANLFCGFDLDTAAEDFGVGVGGFSEEVFIVGRTVKRAG